MWIVRVPPEKIADDRRTFQCPRSEHLLANVRFVSKALKSTDIGQRD